MAERGFGEKDWTGVAPGGVQKLTKYCRIWYTLATLLSNEVS
jgi:hypothetical protein